MSPSPWSPRRWFEVWWRDLRLAARSLRRSPGFSIAVFCTLVVCIGPNTAILSALYALVLRPLPFPDAGQLLVISNVAEKNGGLVTQSSTPQYRDFRENADLFAGFTILQHQNITLDSEETPMRVPNDWVSVDYFDVLGVKPYRGRFFTPEEEQPGRNNVLVLAYDFWVAHYDADPGVVNREFRAGDQVFTIIGVAPPSLATLSKPTCFFQPYVPQGYRLNPQARYLGDCLLFARLKPGVRAATGLAQLHTLEQRFRNEVASPQLRAVIDAAGYRLATERLRPGEVRGQLRPLWLLQGGALLVLLIGAVNVVNLILARLNARRSELAIRVALGAGRLTLLRQVLAETVLLTSAAAVAGIALAAGAIRIFNHYLPTIVRTAPPVTLHLPVVAAILVATLVLAAAVGLLPHVVLWRSGLRLGDARGSTSGAAVRTVSSVLVITQVAVAVILLVGAGLLIRSFAKVAAIRPGFDAARVVQGRIALPSRYSEPGANRDVQRRILRALGEIPGVESVAQVSNFGLLFDYQASAFTIRDDPLTAGESQPQAYVYPVSADYFATMGIRLRDGRVFTGADDFGKDPVVVVDQTFVERYSPDRPVVGRELSPGDGNRPADFRWPHIVGVVDRVNLLGLERRDSLPFVFIPMNGWTTGGFNVLVRTPRPVGDVLRDMRAKLREIDPALPLYATGSLQEGLDSMLMGRRGIMLLLSTFSALALLLAGVGLYGVLAYDVSQRTREIGIRGAIGASREHILGLILRQGLVKTAVGLALGLAGALMLTRYVRSQLFDVVALDPLTYAAVLAVLAGIAALACWLPALRAAKVDPVIALRAE